MDRKQKDESTSLSQKDDHAKSVAVDCENLDKNVFVFKPKEGGNEFIFTMIFNCYDGKLMGTLLAPDPEGEHGLFFLVQKI